ncbi:MAG TPA: sn-glycerol-3-phosphate ABC transporter ATP-binding protein UgpC [Dictyobacter sp.]|jgi:multiple sugar transport system ATP-binding protein|nr:sn-glycerol-3-phosphate ABC transporter ATP-binding protein UgpC [Dictyobacter sp.]
MARVAFEHIYKRFNKTEVVHDVSIDIKDKEFLVLVGPSGCGKSTCLRMVAGLEEPTEGEIYIGDRIVNGVDPKDRDIAMVFQNYALYPHMTVFDNMAFGLKLRHFPKNEIKTRVEEAAGILGLEQYLKRKPKELSGGQRQRVALGRAIVREAQVFLMDEPLSNLDAKLRVATRAEIIKLHQRIQTTTIYVTHDQVEAMTMGDRIAVLNGGIIQQLGSPQELYDHPANMFVAGFIGSPSMNFIPDAKVSTDGGDTFIVLENIGRVKVPQIYAERARAAVDRSLTFGIRPVHLEDASLISESNKEHSAIDASVDVVENLGNELQVYLTTGGKNIIATLDPRSRLTAGNKTRLYVDSDQIHLFDSETTEAIF